MQVKNLDELGRVVLPKEMLRELGVPPRGAVELVCRDGEVVVRRHGGACALCGDSEALAAVGGGLLCGACIDQVKHMA